MKIQLVVAHTPDFGIADEKGEIPWKLPDDLKEFRRLTVGTAVIMGRKTWDSLPSGKKPLPGRSNIIVTRSPDLKMYGACQAGSLETAIAIARHKGHSVINVIGGGEIYRQALYLKLTKLYITHVETDTVCGIFMPDYTDSYKVVSSKEMQDPDSGLKYFFEEWIPK